MVKISENNRKLEAIKKQRMDILIYNLNCHDNPNKIYVHKANRVRKYEDDNIEDLNFTEII